MSPIVEVSYGGPRKALAPLSHELLAYYQGKCRHHTTPADAGVRERWAAFEPLERAALVPCSRSENVKKAISWAHWTKYNSTIVNMPASHEQAEDGNGHIPLRVLACHPRE